MSLLSLVLDIQEKVQEAEREERMGPRATEFLIGKKKNWYPVCPFSIEG